MTRQQVHLRINDSATGQPTPVRLRVTDADGTYYAPYGRLTEFATGVNQDVGGNVMIGGKKWAYIDGACEILLPPGQLHVEIMKGPEYKPIDEDITLLAGKMSLRFTIERWCDMRKEGWYSGDTRVHFMTPDAALLEGLAEDVAVVNLLVKESASANADGSPCCSIPNILSFSGQSFARESGSCGVAVNTQNIHPHLGSLGLLHCHRIVYPLSFADAAWTLDDWCGQCHRKKGLVVWTDPQHKTDEFLFGEPLADAILGNIDAFELTFWQDALANYYWLLDAGILLPLVGASEKDSNGRILGSMRTYAHLPSDRNVTYTNWIGAVREGRTFVSNGPLLHFTVDELVPGTAVKAFSTEKILCIRAEANHWEPFEHLELLWNGQVIAEATPQPGLPHVARLEVEFPVKASGWLAVRCRGETLSPSRTAPQRVFAHSSPVAIRFQEAPGWADAGAVHFLTKELNAMLTWACEEAKTDTPQQRTRLRHLFEEARTVLAKKLS